MFARIIATIALVLIAGSSSSNNNNNNSFLLSVQAQTNDDDCSIRRALISRRDFCLNQECIDVLYYVGDVETTFQVCKEDGAEQRFDLAAPIYRFWWYCGILENRAWVFPAANTLYVTHNRFTGRVRWFAYECESNATSTTVAPTMSPAMDPTMAPMADPTVAPMADPTMSPVDTTTDAPSPTPSCILPSGDRLLRGLFLVCGNERFGISAAAGEIVYLVDEIIIWNAGVSAIETLEMQSIDGNLVGYDASVTAIWASSNTPGTQLEAGSFLQIGGGQRPRVVSGTSGTVLWQIP